MNADAVLNILKIKFKYRHLMFFVGDSVVLKNLMKWQHIFAKSKNKYFFWTFFWTYFFNFFIASLAP